MPTASAKRLSLLKAEKVPRKTVRRLAIYLLALEEMSARGEEVVNSDALANACGFSGNLIRRDLAYFGEFGVRGVGYHIRDLKREIRATLGVERNWPVFLAGVGCLGAAILAQLHGRTGARPRGFDILAAFDSDPDVIGKTVGGLLVQPMSELPATAERERPEIGLVAVRPGEAQKAATLLVEAGARAIINFTPSVLKLPDHVVTEAADFTIPLLTATFDLTRLAHQDRTAGAGDEKGAPPARPVKTSRKKIRAA